MNYVNSVTIVGVVSQEPKFARGKKMPFLSLYVKTVERRKDGTYKECEHYVKCFGEAAERNRSAAVGDIVSIFGKSDVDEYNGKTYKFVSATQMVVSRDKVVTEPHSAYFDEDIHF